MEISKELKIKLSYDLAIPLLGIDSKKMKILTAIQLHSHVYFSIFTTDKMIETI
jgi:hypothetical protein